MILIYLLAVIGYTVIVVALTVRFWPQSETASAPDLDDDETLQRQGCPHLNLRRYGQDVWCLDCGINLGVR